MSDLTFVAGDDAPAIYGTLAIDGVVIDLTGATVKFQMRPVTDRRFVIDSAAAVVTPTAGAVRYDWLTGDLATPGEYVSRWEITFADTSVQHSEPENTITVDLT